MHRAEKFALRGSFWFGGWKHAAPIEAPGDFTTEVNLASLDWFLYAPSHQ